MDHAAGKCQGHAAMHGHTWDETPESLAAEPMPPTEMQHCLPGVCQAKGRVPCETNKGKTNLGAPFFSQHPCAFITQCVLNVSVPWVPSSPSCLPPHQESSKGMGGEFAPEGHWAASVDFWFSEFARSCGRRVSG